MITLLFSHEAVYLGELVTRDGALRHVVLTQAGEQVIGGYVQQWQTRGVPVFKGITKQVQDGKNEFIAYREYVNLRDATFLSAIKEWAISHQIQVHDIAEPILPLWERLLRLPLENGERFRFLIAIEKTPASRLPAWFELLKSAEEAAQLERDKTQAALVKLKTTVSKHLLHAFEQEERSRV